MVLRSGRVTFSPAEWFAMRCTIFFVPLRNVKKGTVLPTPYYRGIWKWCKKLSQDGVVVFAHVLGWPENGLVQLGSVSPNPAIKVIFTVKVVM